MGGDLEGEEGREPASHLGMAWGRIKRRRKRRTSVRRKHRGSGIWTRSFPPTHLPFPLNYPPWDIHTNTHSPGFLVEEDPDGAHRAGDSLTTTTPPTMAGHEQEAWVERPPK